MNNDTKEFLDFCAPEQSQPLDELAREATLLSNLGFCATDSEGNSRPIIAADVPVLMLIVKASRERKTKIESQLHYYLAHTKLALEVDAAFNKILKKEISKMLASPSPSSPPTIREVCEAAVAEAGRNDCAGEVKTICDALDKHSREQAAQKDPCRPPQITEVKSARVYDDVVSSFSPAPVYQNTEATVAQAERDGAATRLSLAKNGTNFGGGPEYYSPEDLWIDHLIEQGYGSWKSWTSLRSSAGPNALALFIEFFKIPVATVWEAASKSSRYGPGKSKD